MFKYVHHINYVVGNRDEMVAYMERTFGMRPDKVSEPARGVGRQAEYRVGPTIIRFREPTPGSNPSPELFEKRGPGVYLVSWAVDNLSQVAQELRAKGVYLREGEGPRQSPLGHYAINIDPTSPNGPPLFFQLAEDPR